MKNLIFIQQFFLYLVTLRFYLVTPLFFLVTPLCGVTGVALAATPFTLEQCISRGLAFNPDVKAYELAVDEAGQGINEARGAFLPTLTLSYNNTELKNNSSVVRDNDYLDQQSNSYSCSLTQPLFAGFSGISGLKKAHYTKQFKKYESQYRRQQLIQQISSSFYDIVQGQQLLQKWSESVERLDNQRLIAAAWVEQELAPRLRLLEIDVELANARQQLSSSKASLAIAQAQLEEWLAFDSAEQLEINYDAAENYVDPCTDIAACIATALQQRVEQRIVQLNIEIARQEAKLILARNLPRADFEASWVDYERDYEASYPDEKRDYYSFVFKVSMKPFQGGRNLFAWRRQRIAIERMVQLQIKQRQAIITDVKTRFEQLQEGYSGGFAADNGLVEAREAYQVASKSSEVGVSSLNELLDAELRLTRAEINKITSQHSLYLAHVQLQYALGEQK
ncbi:MAG: TolC family protein [Pseudomonadota bacterium]|nr:TolC family protein [Pseudomonadota bacterium]